MMQGFDNSLAHVMAVVERIDLLIQTQVWHARQASALGKGAFQFRGMAVE